MELKKKTFLFFEPALDETAAPEAGADMIVPDLYPDIARIVDASGQACLKDRTLREDRLDLAGLARVSVLYVPEGEQRLRKLDVSIPFNHVFDGRFPQGSEALADVKLLSVSARAINPRKVSILCALSVHAVVYAPGTLEIGDEVTGECEVRRAVYSSYVPVDVKCKYFTMTESLEIPGTRPPVDEILRASPRLTVTDIKHVGNKIIFKGTAAMGLLYLSGGQPYFTEQELPLSQIVEMDALEEGAGVEIELQLTGMDLDIGQTPGGEARRIDLSLHLEAQAVARSERRMEAIIDLYSTSGGLRPVMEPALLTELIDRGVRRQSVRELLEVGDEVHSVVDTLVTLGPPAEGVMGCEALVRIVFLSEAGEYQSLLRRLPVVCEGLERARLRARLAGEVTAVPTSDGIELRFSVDFEYLCLDTSRIMTVGELVQDELFEKPVRPSVVIRRCREGESLWDIAKAYGTTVRELVTANGLEEGGEAADDRLLLIPKKR